MSDVPEFVTLIGGDNRPVAVPVWMAKKILHALEQFNRGQPRTRTPGCAAEFEDCESDLRELIAEAEGAYNST